MGLLPDWMIERDIKIEPFSPQQHRPGVISYGVTSYGYDVRAGYKWKVFDAIAGGVVDPKNFNPKLLREFDLTPQHEWVKHGIGPASRWRCRLCETQAKMEGEDRVVLDCPPRPNTFITIPPNSYVLGESMETFTIPRDVACICVGKSTFARCGIIVNVTPGEPEWTGKWTIEISNSSPLPAMVYCGEGIMQCMFIRSDGYRDLIVRAIKDMLYDDHSFTFDRMVSVGRSVWNSFWETVTCNVSYADKKGKYQGQTGLTTPIVEKGNSNV